MFRFDLLNDICRFVLHSTMEAKNKVRYVILEIHCCIRMHFWSGDMIVLVVLGCRVCWTLSRSHLSASDRTYASLSSSGVSASYVPMVKCWLTIWKCELYSGLRGKECNLERGLARPPLLQSLSLWSCVQLHPNKVYMYNTNGYVYAREEGSTCMQENLWTHLLVKRDMCGVPS